MILLGIINNLYNIPHRVVGVQDVLQNIPARIAGGKQSDKAKSIFIILIAGLAPIAIMNITPLPFFVVVDVDGLVLTA